jgi:hypothetical protein
MNRNRVLPKTEHRTATGFALINGLADTGRNNASLRPAVVDEEPGFLRATLVMIAP